jgi:predicted MFS family arabinose efflux permease
VETTNGPQVRLTGRQWLLLILLAGVQFTNVLDFMIVLPLGKFYMEKMRLSPQQFSIVASVYGYCAAASGLLAARFMDRFDRKRALMVLYTGFTVATLLCGLAYDYPTLLIGRGLAGAFGGIVGACVLAIVGDAFPETRRATAMGAVMSAFSVAGIIGIPIGLTLAQEIGLWCPFIAIATVAGVGLLVVGFIMPPMRDHLTRAAGTDPVGFWELATRPNLLRAHCLMAAVVMSGFILAPFFAPFLTANVGLRKEDLRWVYLCGGLATVVSMQIVGRLSDRFGRLRVFRILALVNLIPLLVCVNLPPVSLAVALTVTTVFWVTSSGRMVPAMTLVTTSAAPRYRGSFMSLNTVVQHVFMAMAATLGGLIIGEKGEGQALTNVSTVGLVAAALAILSVILAGQLRPAAEEAVADPNSQAEEVPEAVIAG